MPQVEGFEHAPQCRQDRGRAFLALILYGIDPGEFELGPDDRPPATDLRALSKLRITRPGWMRGTAGGIHQLLWIAHHWGEPSPAA